MSYEDFRKQATTDALSLQENIRSQAEIASDTGDGLVLARALANALIAVGQNYLAANATEEDVELFFEVYGRQPDDVAAWPVTILAGLRMQRIGPDSWQMICENTTETAVRYIRSKSSLAWG